MTFPFSERLKIGGIFTSEKEIIKDGIFADLSAVFGKMQWPPIAAYLFANVFLLIGSDKIVLVLTEERKDKNIWVPPGGELWYKILEQFRDAASREAGKEEMGIEINIDKLKLFDVQIGYPVEESPYKEKGITSVIVYYIYPITEEELKKMNINAVREAGCNIVGVMTRPVPEILDDIEKSTINVYSAVYEALKKLAIHLKEGK